MTRIIYDKHDRVLTYEGPDGSSTYVGRVIRHIEIAPNLAQKIKAYMPETIKQLRAEGLIDE